MESQRQDVRDRLMDRPVSPGLDGDAIMRSPMITVLR
jgi:hypothetical protein